MHSPYGQATFVTSRPIPLAPAGLLPDRAMAPLWICPANAVHTVGMLFSFDLVLIDKDFKVVGIRELLRPFRITMPNSKAESVIELPAHSIFRSRTQIGDQLTIERYDPKKAPPEGTPTPYRPNGDHASGTPAFGSGCCSRDGFCKCDYVFHHAFNCCDSVQGRENGHK